MKPKDLAIILLRAFAVWVLYQAILMLEQIPIELFIPISGDQSFGRFYSVMNSFNLILHLFLGLALLLKVDYVAQLLVRDVDQSESTHIGMSDLAIVSFGLAGLFILVDGVEKAMIQVISYYYKPTSEFGSGLIKAEFNTAIFIAGAAKAVLGLVIMLSPSGVVKALKWTRGAGKQPEITA